MGVSTVTDAVVKMSPDEKHRRPRRKRLGANLAWEAPSDDRRAVRADSMKPYAVGISFHDSRSAPADACRQARRIKRCGSVSPLAHQGGPTEFVRRDVGYVSLPAAEEDDILP